MAELGELIDAAVRLMTCRAAAPQAAGEREEAGKAARCTGAHLAWRDVPDDTVPLFPAGPCPCGRDLAGAADLGVTGSRQVINVPLAAAKVVQAYPDAIWPGQAADALHALIHAANTALNRAFALVRVCPGSALASR